VRLEVLQSRNAIPGSATSKQRAEPNSTARRVEVDWLPRLRDLDTPRSDERSGGFADERHQRPEIFVAAEYARCVGWADRLARLSAREQVEDRGLGVLASRLH
jgi:hypothetical protein